MRDYREEIHQVIQAAVQRAGGHWKQSFRKEMEQIIRIVCDEKRESEVRGL